jgi:hypothetical protein
LALLVACAISGIAAMPMPSMAQSNNQAQDKAQDYIPTPGGIKPSESPAQPIPAPPAARDIGSQILNRVVLENVWGAPIHCSIRQSIQIFGTKRSSFGSYIRGGRGTLKMRLTLQVPAGDQMNSVLQISDGDLQTTYERIGSHSMMTQIDLAKVQDRIVITRDLSQDPIKALYLSVGGQAEELRKVSQKYDWTKVTEGQLGDQKVWWIRGQAMDHPLHTRASALVDTRLFEKPYDAEIPANIKLAIGHLDSDFPFWVYQVEKWNDGDALGRGKYYVLTEWDSPTKLQPSQITDELFRRSTDQSLQEIRDETKLYLPPVAPQPNLATKPNPIALPSR